MMRVPKIIEKDGIIDEAKYSDVVRISHTYTSFILDFGYFIPPREGEEPKIYIHTRIYMSPQHAKLLLKALQDNIRKYEQKVGEIRLPEKREERPSTIIM
ncbi:MAG TPA: DUF3467 domain-containing protein [Acidilobales archaeon]|nr:MAG: DUF3467 domain-containing protein [Thermoprotei archaeon]HDD26433.1 DUF3467 domain-containing protein [Acidilobales archaeon]